MKKNSLIPLLAGTVLIIGTISCDREYKREARIAVSLLTTGNAWLTNNSLAAKATCDVTFFNRDPQLDVVGIIATDKQDAFDAAIRGNSTPPSCIRFWKEKPAFSFAEVVVPEASPAPREKLESEAKDKLLRTVKLR